ncbi:MAG: DUF2163 domain-containing protein [Pseudoruegeria sp.]
MAVLPEFEAHLKTGTTTVCRCWSVERCDGVVLGFTDHDGDLSFGGVQFMARTGLAPKSLQQTTGLSVDNSEAIGILSDDAVTDVDIQAGRYDKAVVTAWLVNWSNVAQRHKQFKGLIGEINHGKGQFTAELRGLADVLNQPQGQVYQKSCNAVLGDARCSIDLTHPTYSIQVLAEEIKENQTFTFSDFDQFEAGWFTHGTLRVLSGAAKGLCVHVKSDLLMGSARVIATWEELRADVVTGDQILLQVGCDKRVETCRLKFLNYENYRGFPHIPGEDWMLSYPVQGDDNSGGKLSQ